MFRVTRRAERAALRDPLASKALCLMHESPHIEWTVEAMAERVACSRSLLAERFKTVIGEAPMHYLTRVRMQHAARRLSDSRCSVEASRPVASASRA